MATGLRTFDAFSWASLLAGRPILVVDRDRARGRANAEALEEAGAIVTLAPNQAVAADRVAENAYRHVLLSLAAGEAVADRLEAPLRARGRGAVILADRGGHETLRAAFDRARLADHAMDARSLVLFLTETPDE